MSGVTTVPSTLRAKPDCYFELLHSKNQQKANAKVVLLHGFLQDSTCWKKTAKKLRENHGYDVLLIDFYGHGKSRHLSDFRNHNASTYTQQVRDVILHVGWDSEKICFAGISLGGAVTQLYFTKFSENVGRVVLVAPAGHVEPWWKLSRILHTIIVIPVNHFLEFSANKSARIHKIYNSKPVINFTSKMSVVKNTPDYGVPREMGEKLSETPLSIIYAGLDEFHGVYISDWSKNRTKGVHFKVVVHTWMSHMIICSLIDWLELDNEPSFWAQKQQKPQRAKL